MIFVVVVRDQGRVMDHEKFEVYTRLFSEMSTSLVALLRMQEALVETACRECDIPLSMKSQIIADLNKAIGLLVLSPV